MKRTQASGSVAIDLSHVVAEIERASREAAQALQNSMAQLQQAMANLAASANRRTLNEAETIATLSCHLPAGLSTDAVGDGHRIAAFQAERLAQAGYALVAVSGPALEHAVATGDVLADFTSAAKRAAGVPVRGGTVRMNGSPYPEVVPSAEYLNAERPVNSRSERRADQRLAQATSDRESDSWFEPEE